MIEKMVQLHRMRCLDPAVWQEFKTKINPSDMPTSKDLELPIPLEWHYEDHDEGDKVRLIKLESSNKI